MPTPHEVIEAPRAVVDGQEQACTVLVHDGRIVGVEDFGTRPHADHRCARRRRGAAAGPGRHPRAATTRAAPTGRASSATRAAAAVG